MSKSQELLVKKFWERVFSTPERSSVLLKNKSRRDQVIVTDAGPFPVVSVLPPVQLISIDWRAAGAAVATIMAYLRKTGFVKGDRAAILAWNCPEWVWADLAIQSMGGVTVPIYPHSTPDQVNYVLRDAQCSVVFSNEKEQLAKVVKTRAVHFDQIPGSIDEHGQVKRSFVDWFTPAETFGYLDEHPVGPLAWPRVKVELAMIQAEILMGARLFAGLSSDDLATIIYTSGSTGTPKGCCLTHGNIAAACQSLVSHGFQTDSAYDVYLSYLPLAHVYERVDGMAMSIWSGLPVAFCKVDEVGEALKVYKPTVLCGVPAVWRKMKDKIQSKLDAEKGIKRLVIKWAFAQRKRGFKRWLADLLVFAKIRNELGGDLRLLLSGGAPISPEIIEFFSVAGLDLLLGYGLTETAGGISTNRPVHLHKKSRPANKVGTVGELVPGMEVKFDREPGADPKGDGEIWLRGPLVFKGYWNLPEESAKVLTDDGWFKTGDLGRLDEQGFLLITGRKKRMLKTDGGKYVAPEKIEKSFESDPIVHYVVPVGDGKPYISGLVFLNIATAREQFGKDLPVGADPAVFFAAHEGVKNAVAGAVAKANGQLERWEQLKKFTIVPVEASVPSGLLTPTLKIRTEEVLKRFKTLAEAFYAK